MIRLLVEKYCQNCSNFEPETIGPEVIFENDKYTAVDTHVVCKNRERCIHIEMTIREEIKNEQS